MKKALSEAGKQQIQFFSDALGADAVVSSQETGRPYIKVATRGPAALYMNVDLAKVCYHPPVAEGEEEQHVTVVGVCVRFFQKGGDNSHFGEAIEIRGEEAGLIRLAKYEFPVCNIVGVDIQQSLTDQKVVRKLLAWVKSFGEKLPGIEFIPDALLKQVIEVNITSVKKDTPFKALFDVNVQQESHASKVAKVQAIKEKIAQSFGKKLGGSDDDEGGPLLN